MTKKFGQKIKYLEYKKSFQGEIKAFTSFFKGLLIAKNCLRPEIAYFTFSSKIKTYSLCLLKMLKIKK